MPGSHRRQENGYRPDLGQSVLEGFLTLGKPKILAATGLTRTTSDCKLFSQSAGRRLLAVGFHGMITTERQGS